MLSKIQVQGANSVAEALALETVRGSTKEVMDITDDASTASEVYIDQFGFFTDAPTTCAHLRRDNARLEKWQEMLGRWEFMKRSRQKKVKSRTRKGIPDCLRGTVWLDFAGSRGRTESQDLYKVMKLSEETSRYEAQIRKDVYRTFPRHVFFRELSGQDALYRLLRAYSLHNTEIGYCQGMGFIAGLLLTYVPEDSAFGLMDSLMKAYGMQSLYAAGMPGVYKTMYVAQELGLTYLPKVFRHLQDINLSATLYAVNWIMTLFACSLPIETVVRIWDCFFMEGHKIIYRVFLGIIKLCEKELRSQGFEEALQTIKDKVQTVTPEELLPAAFSFHLSRTRITQLERDFDAQGNPSFQRW